MLDNAQAVSGIGMGLVVLLAAIGSWVRWLRPRVRKIGREVTGVRDSILGREAIHDSITGKEIAPALPGVGVRLAENERHLSVLSDAVAKIADSHVRLEDHESRIQKLEEAAVERVVGKAESIAAYRAIEAAAQASPPEDEA